MPPACIPPRSRFQSTLSMRRATRKPRAAHCMKQISIHALHEESDQFFGAAPQAADRFQSTLSMRRATRLLDLLTVKDEISIHALHEESDNQPLITDPFYCISIHALHEESDLEPFSQPLGKQNFNPRSP